MLLISISAMIAVGRSRRKGQQHRQSHGRPAQAGERERRGQHGPEFKDKVTRLMQKDVLR
jgi:hypothetical protein